jgi:homocysteine S-methyltransferase
MRVAISSPVDPFLDGGGVLILDGGLATELERAGHDLAHPLWSARLLRAAPAAIAAVHREYLEAGADCITSASYQASLPGFRREGLDHAEAEGLIRLSVTLALEARDAFWTAAAGGGDRRRPLVAASVGPYGAYRADGSEYTGSYDLDEAGLVAFHRDRLDLLLGAGADLLACETIPSAAEARALARLLSERPGARAFLSFACRDGAHLCDGTPFAEAAGFVADVPQVVAVGVNCTAPSHVESLLREAARVTAKPLAAYPNSGETWDAGRRTWRGLSDPEDWADKGRRWRAAGARLIGGCCRTGPAHVRALRHALAG